PVLGLLGVVTVDRLDLEQRQIALALLRRPDLTEDRVPGPEVETLDLRRADVDVIRPVEVVPVLGPEEAVSLGQDLEHALAAQDHVAVEQFLLDPEDEILFTKAGIVRDIALLRHLVQLCNRLALQFGDVHESLRWNVKWV